MELGADLQSKWWLDNYLGKCYWMSVYEIFDSNSFARDCYCFVSWVREIFSSEKDIVVVCLDCTIFFYMSSQVHFMLFCQWNKGLGKINLTEILQFYSSQY